MASDSNKDLNQKLSDLSISIDQLASIKFDFLQNYYSKSTENIKTLKDFVLYNKVGKGAFAVVYFAVDSHSNKETFAMKVLNKIKVIKDEQVEHVKSEKRLLQSLCSDFIIKLHHNFQDERNLYLALEYVPGGELFKFIRSRLYFSEDTAKFYSMQIILALEYLHNLDIVYRDIKPENILISSQGYLKLADFGFAKLMLDNRTYTLCGTPEYLAPETILNRGYGMAVDWWAIGVFIYELLCGHTPFYQVETRRIYEKIVLCKYKFPIHISNDAKSLISKFLEPDLTKRLGNLRKKTGDIKKNRWFLTNNTSTWTRIYNKTQELPKEILFHKIPSNPELRNENINVLACSEFENDTSKELFKDF